MIVFLPSEADLFRVISHITFCDKEINLSVRKKHTPHSVQMSKQALSYTLES